MPVHGGLGFRRRGARAVVAREEEHDEGIRRRIGDAIAEGQLPSLRRLADLAVRDDELVELLATQAGRRAWEFVVELYTRMGVQEVPTSVWNGFQSKALGLHCAYLAVLFHTMLATSWLSPLFLPEAHWAIHPCFLAGASFLLQVAIELAGSLRHRHPTGHLALLLHAAVHGLLWGLPGWGTAGRLLPQLAGLLGFAWLAAFANTAWAAPGSDPKQHAHVRAWLSGWLAGALLLLAAASWLGTSRLAAVIVAVEALAVAAGSREQCLKLLEQCKLDDAALVTVAAVSSLLMVVHAQLLLHFLWCLAASFLQSVMTTKVAYYVCINCAGAALLSRCLSQGQKDPFAHGGLEAARTQ